MYDGDPRLGIFQAATATVAADSYQEMKPLERIHRPRTWLSDEEEEVTTELDLLGGLVRSPTAILPERAGLEAARQILVDQRVPAIAVVDESHALRGLVTRTDVLRTLARDPDGTVGDAMSSFVFALPNDSTVEAAAALMAIEGVGQVVVTGRAGELIGMVSAVDVARYVAVRAGYLAG
jgi:CBS domain-containing protein